MQLPTTHCAESQKDQCLKNNFNIIVIYLQVYFQLSSQLVLNILHVSTVNYSHPQRATSVEVTFSVLYSLPHTSLLTTWGGILTEKLTVYSWSRNSPHFMEPEGSLPHSQVPATCPYPQPDRFSLCAHFPLHEDPS